MQPRGQAGTISLSGSALPNVAFICGNCGYTFLMNVFLLGLADLFGTKSVATEQAESSAPEPAPASVPVVE